MSLKLETENTHVEKWLTDVSFDMHQDIDIHNEYTMSLGKGYVYSIRIH